MKCLSEPHEEAQVMCNHKEEKKLRKGESVRGNIPLYLTKYMTITTCKPPQKLAQQDGKALHEAKTMWVLGNQFPSATHVGKAPTFLIYDAPIEKNGGHHHLPHIILPKIMYHMLALELALK